MINTNYYNAYNQYMASQKNKGKANGKAMDKTHMSKNMEYLAKAKEAAGKTAAKGQPANEAKSTEKSEFTQEDFQKLYAKLNGINYGEYDEADSYRSMANSFLNQMVFSPMGSSDLFTPQISRNVLSAAFNAAYDTSGVEEKIRNASDGNATDSGKENFEVSDGQEG